MSTASTTPSAAHVETPTATISDLRAELHTKGFVVIPTSIFQLDEATLQQVQTEVDRLFAGHYATGIYPDEIHWRPGISDPQATRELCNAWKASYVIRRLVCGTTLGQLACQLMSHAPDPSDNTTNNDDSDIPLSPRPWHACRIGQDDVLYKPPQSPAVGFHQDSTYISDNFEPREHTSLTMWMALDRVDPENGAMQYAPGSHLWKTRMNGKHTGEGMAGHTNAVEDASFHLGKEDDPLVNVRKAYSLHQKVVAAEGQSHILLSNNGTSRTTSDDTTEDDHRHETAAELTIHTIPLVQPGQLIVHHQAVWHGSCPNRSTTRIRRAVVAHLLAEHVQWRPSPPPSYIYGRYVIRGESQPREDFFPITYSDDSTCSRTEWLDEDDHHNGESSSKYCAIGFAG